MGHKKAALAIKEAFDEKGIETEVIDTLEYATPWYRFLYMDFYVFVSTHMKWLWWIIYYFSDIKLFDILTRRGRALSDYKDLPGLAEELIRKSPDIIISTHFMLPSIARLLKKRGLRCALYTLVTDYGPHYCWFSRFINGFFVGSEMAKSELIKKGVTGSRIFVTGIPADLKFVRDFDAGKIREEFSLDPGKRTIFIMSGGFGAGPIESILESLNSSERGIQVIAVCGHNRDLYRKISSKKYNYKFIPVGFTDKVAEIMFIADLMISKAGGLTVTEALNSRLPLILYASIPGQETWNVKFLLQNGAARKAGKISDISRIVNEILGSEKEYNRLIAGIDQIRRPEAARDIVNIMLRKNR
jgi:processive 1,2-diacylglycerol beta-glucosyltransferase